MKKYLVLGGNGFIGGYLVKELAKSNYVMVADMVPKQDTRSWPNIEYQSLNFIETKDFSAYLQGVDTVVHLISTVFPEEGTTNIRSEIGSNIFPTITLLDSMVRTGVKKIIFISSGGTVYGEKDSQPIKENSVQLPICKYGVYKLMIEKFLHLYKQYHGLEYRVLRLSNPYSAKARKGRLQGIIPIFIKKILDGEPITVWGDGNNIRDYIYIRDAIDAIIAVDFYAGYENIFNIGSGVGYSIRDIIDIIVKILGCKYPEVHYIEKRECDIRQNILDVGLIKKCTGWQAQTDIETGIKQCILKCKSFNNNSSIR